MRLIDADALKQREITMRRGDGYSDFVFAADIHRAPTVDAVPVVRCKDCKWYYRPFEIEGMRYEGDCGFHEWYRASPEENDFCSMGERKDV